jgi:fructose-specific phosphotransferase system IIC component
MFLGGVIRWLVDRRMRPEDRHAADADSGPGVLFSSGLIAGGAIMGVVLAGLAARHLDEAFDLTKAVGGFGTSVIVSLIGYVVLLAVPLYLVARRVQRTIG